MPERRGPKLEIAAANGNFVDLSSSIGKARSLLRGADEYAGTLAETGYDGFELHPLRDRFFWQIVGRSAVRAAFDAVPVCPEDLADMVQSFHQAFTEKDAGVAAKAAMPVAEQSMATLARLASLLGPRDQVVYPDRVPEVGAFTDENSGPGRRAAQPAAEMWRKLGIRSIEEQYAHFRRLGISHVTPDTFHDRRNDYEVVGNYLPRWENTWPQYAAAGDVFEVHVAVGRTDMGEANSGKIINPYHLQQTQQELLAIIADEPEALGRTELLQMLLAICEYTTQPGLRLVTETPVAALVAARGLATARNLTVHQAHANMVNNLRVNLAPYTQAA